MMNLFDDATAKIKGGVTTEEEVYRVIDAAVLS